MRLTYYIQTNLACIALVLFTMYYLNTSTSSMETSSRIFFKMLEAIVAFCIADIGAVLLSGSVFPGSWYLSHFFNTVYYIVPVVMSYMWYIYIKIKLNKYKDYKTEAFKQAIPTVIFCLLLMSNPLSKLFFTIDEANLYHRGPLFAAHQLFCWISFLITFFMVLMALKGEKNEFKRREYRNYSLFIVPIAVTALSQFMVYGITSTQIGFTFSIIVVLFTSQQARIHRDELTGLNNRNSFVNYVINVSYNPKNDNYTVVMIDVDQFKSINDTYGHLVGDEALQHTAKVLMRAAGAIESTRLHIYRFGGDEFIVIGVNTNNDTIEQFKSNLNKELDAENSIITNGYKIELSVGVSNGVVNGSGDMRAIINEADKAMYKLKNTSKQ